MSVAQKLLFSAVVLVVALAVPEIAIRLSGFQAEAYSIEVDENRDFYVEHQSIEHDDWYLVSDGVARSNPDLVKQGFHDYSFPVDPGARPRLFALGGSTTFGIPFEHRERGFSERLEGVLASRGHKVEVINAGVAGMSSVSFPWLAREMVALGADGLIIYSGNNEFYRYLAEPCTDSARSGLEALLNHSYTYLYLRGWYRAYNPPVFLTRDELFERQEACIREQALAASRDPKAWPERADKMWVEVLSTYRQSLEEVLDIAAGAGVPVWLVRPPVNLQQPPSLPAHDPALDEQTIARFEGLGGEPMDLLRAEERYAIDPLHAGALYDLGMIRRIHGIQDEAIELLEASLTRDFQTGRPPRALRDVVSALCQEREGARCVDLQPVFIKASKGPPGPFLFVDHCHPTFEQGVSLIAETLADSLEASGLLRQ